MTGKHTTAYTSFRGKRKHKLGCRGLFRSRTLFAIDKGLPPMLASGPIRGFYRPGFQAAALPRRSTVPLRGTPDEDRPCPPGQETSPLRRRGLGRTTMEILFRMIQAMSVFVVIAYLYCKSPLFISLTTDAVRTRDRLYLYLVFSGLSIMGTYLGVPVQDAIANNRAIGPVLAGIIGGPLLGTAVGLTGGIHRYFLGGFTAFSCGLATTLAGLFGGMVHLWLVRRNHPERSTGAGRRRGHRRGGKPARARVRAGVGKDVGSDGAGRPHLRSLESADEQRPADCRLQRIQRHIQSSVWS